MVAPDHAVLERIAGLADRGLLRPLVADTFPLEKAADAHRLSRKGSTTGKIVLTLR